MKKIILSVALFSMTFSSCDILSKLPTGTGITEAEAGQGIKEALGQGLVKAVLNLNKTDGFFGSQFYKVLLPPDAVKIENTLRDLGMGRMVDKAILSINRAAEDAVGYAKPIFVSAIKDMTLMDAINIVKGPKDAATNYFKGKTREALLAAFLPSIKSSLDKVDATKYYFPTTFKKINPDLPSFVVEKATDALFDQIAKEEANIRENPVARTTEILRKVFGGI